MKQDPVTKSVMEGYEGVKFKAVRISERLSGKTPEVYILFRRICERLRKWDMTPANGGNISCRHKKGFFISASGSNLGCMEEDEVIFVEHCDIQRQEVQYRGPKKPSSESILHWMVYKDYKESGAIIHAHQDLVTHSELLDGVVKESSREEPYGSVALASMASKTLKDAGGIIVLKNHGYVATGGDLERACERLIKTHQSLLHKAEKQAITPPDKGKGNIRVSS